MTDKLSCQIAQDLMPLVLDDACSAESKSAVENHVSQCPPCAEVYAQMKEAPALSPTSATTEENKRFGKAMKRQARVVKLRVLLIWCCAIVLFIGAVSVATYWQSIVNLRRDVPVSWFKQAQLVQTQDGTVFLKITPDAAYQHFYGFNHSDGGPLYDKKTKALVGYERNFYFGSPLFPALLSKDTAYAMNQHELMEARIGKHSNGDWIVPGITGNEYLRVVDGQLMEGRFHNLDETEIKTLVESGTAVSQLTMIFHYEADYWADSTLKIAGPGGALALYAPGDEIPLCDDEIEQIYRKLKDAYPQMFHQEGDLTEGQG